MMRIQRGVVWVAVVVAAGCSSSLATPPGGTGGLGAGGASGEGGVPTTGGAGTGGLAGGGGGGTSGLAGAGGIGGGGWAGSDGGIPSTGGVGGAMLPICARAGGAADGGLGGAAAVDVESCAYDADNNPVFTTVSAAVKVVSVDQVPAGNCSFLGLPFSTSSSPPSSKVVLETAEQQRWTVYLRIPDMPANTIQVGDSFDLAIDGWKSSISGFFSPPEQMVSLEKSGHTVVFGDANGTPSSLYPAGITFDFGPATCQDPPLFAGCYGFAHYPMNVTDGADTAVVQEGETRQVGGLTFTLSHAVGWQQSPAECDGSSYLLLGGFVASP